MQHLKSFGISLGVQQTTVIRRMRTSGTRKNAFLVLGIPPNSSLETAQKQFLKLAMKYHPDVAVHHDNENKKKQNAEAFIRIRTAFEQIRKQHTLQKSLPPIDEVLTEELFLHWFYDQTAVRLTSIQRRELDQLYWRHRHLRERGPTWDLARRLVELQDVFLKNRERIYRESSKKGDTNNASSVDIKSSKSKGLNLRRRRRRK